MKYYTIAPPSSLRKFVRFFWVLESDEPYIHLSMAQVCTEMIFHYHGVFDEIVRDGKTERSFTSGVQFQSDAIRRFSISHGFGIFGVYLYPYTLPLMHKTPAPEFTNEMLDTRTLLGQEGIELEEKMMDALNNQERMKLLISFLEYRLKNVPLTKRCMSHAVRFVIESPIQTKVEKLADQFALSERQFERKFKALSGFSPKKFSRIARFHVVMNSYGDAGKSLTDIAHDCGYYDQSHFIHEFRQFSGLQPSAYFHGGEGAAWRA